MNFRIIMILSTENPMFRDRLENGFPISKMVLLLTQRVFIEEMQKNGINYYKNVKLMILFKIKNLK